MSHIGYLLQDAWEKLVALPLDFWLASAAVTFGFAVFGCLFWSVPTLFGPLVRNIKLLFLHFPLLWISFQIIAIFFETKNEVFLFIGCIVFGLYALIVQFKDEIPPR